MRQYRFLAHALAYLFVFGRVGSLPFPWDLQDLELEGSDVLGWHLHRLVVRIGNQDGLLRGMDIIRSSKSIG
jgi:hypothetical protein